MTTAVEEKLDLFKGNPEYAAKTKPALVKTGPAVYLAVDGQGSPDGDAFGEAIGALYGMAFTIKMTRKFAGLGDYAVSKLEALWPEMDGNPGADKTQWKWTVMIRTPDFVTAGDLTGAAGVLTKRGKGAGVSKVRLMRLNEGLCVQALHIGPYDEECKTIAAMKEFAAKSGMKFAGAHHEIYLSDPRRVEPARLKTILREPVKKG
jgi:hypothetical protein